MRTAAARPRTGSVGANNSLVREEDPILHPRLRTLSLPAALIVLLLLLTAAPIPGAAQEPVTLRVWDQFVGPESETVEAVYAAFMEANPDIVIERDVIDDQTLRDTANVALGSGTG